MNKQKMNLCFFSVCWIVLLGHMLILKGVEKQSVATKQGVYRYLIAQTR